MHALLLWVAKNPLTSAMGGAILLLSSVVAIQTYRVGSLTAQLAQSEKREVVCEANEQALTKSLEEQNEAVGSIAKEHKQANSEASKRASEALRQPLPKAEGKGAEALNRWLETF